MIHKCLAFALVAVFALLPGRGYSMTKTGEFPVPEEPENMFVAGSYLYVACHDSGLRIYDVSNPASVTQAGAYDSSARQEGFYDVAVSGSYAFCAAGGSGIDIINISNPANPQRVDHVAPVAGSAEHIAYQGGYVYTAAYSAGMDIFNVGAVGSASHTAAYFVNADSSSYEPPTGIAVSGHFAYLAFEDSGLYVINIQNPLSPVLAGVYQEPDGMRISAVAVRGNYAYLSTSDEGVKIIDVSTPASPQLAGEYHRSQGGDGWDVAVEGQALYLLYQEWGVYLVDVGNPASPSYIARYPGGIAFNGDYRYMAVSDTIVYMYYDESQSVYILDARQDIGIEPPAQNATHVNDNISVQFDYGLFRLSGFSNTTKYLGRLALYSPLGQCLSACQNVMVTHGAAIWNPKVRPANGNYFIKITADGKSFVRRVGVY